VCAFAAPATAISLTPPSASPVLRISRQVHALTDKIESASRKSFPRTSSSTQNPARLVTSTCSNPSALSLSASAWLCMTSPPRSRTPLFVELHLEVDETSASRSPPPRYELEDGIRGLGKDNVDVNIHIEPLGRHIATPDTRAGEMRQLEMSVESFLNGMPSTYDELINCHDVRVRQVEHQFWFPATA